MRDVIYGLVEERYQLQNERRTAFGIAAYADFEAEGTRCIVAAVHDLSPDEDAVAALVARCNACRLSPEHLAEVALDAMGELIGED